ncbi:MAG: hypothetical protein LBF89_05315 [Bacteroidales bacterium]|nr:hypothetical protein [Bacteroidales bacterium]
MIADPEEREEIAKEEESIRIIETFTESPTGNRSKPSKNRLKRLKKKTGKWQN